MKEQQKNNFKFMLELELQDIHDGIIFRTRFPKTGDKPGKLDFRFLISHSVPRLFIVCCVTLVDIKK